MTKQLTQSEWDQEQLARAKRMHEKFVVGCDLAYTRKWSDLAFSHNEGWLALAADAMAREGIVVVEEPVVMTATEEWLDAYWDMPTTQSDRERANKIHEDVNSIVQLARLLDARDAAMLKAKADAVAEYLDQNWGYLDKSGTCSHVRDLITEANK